MASLLLKQVGFHYQDGFSLQNIDLLIPEKSFLALIGPNGSGKTTLLHLMSGRGVADGDDGTRDRGRAELRDHLDRAQ